MNKKVITAIVVGIFAVLFICAGIFDPAFQNFLALNPIGAPLIAIFLLTCLGGLTYAILNITPGTAATPAPTTTGTGIMPTLPALSRFAWVILVIIAAALVFCWAYFDIPAIYLVHLAVIVVLTWKLMSSSALSTYQQITALFCLGIVVLGVLIVPKEPIHGYVVVTGVVPLLIALMSVFATPGGPTDRYAELLAKATALFVVIYTISGWLGMPMLERVTMCLIVTLVLLAMMPEVRMRFFPTSAGLTNRSQLLLGALVAILVVGTLLSVFGMPNFGWLMTTNGLVMLLLLLWVLPIPQLKVPAKILISIIIVIVLLRNFLLGATSGAWGGFQWLLQFISSSGLLYTLFLIIFIILGLWLAAWLKVWKMVGIIILLLAFAFLFGRPPVKQFWPSWGSFTAPSIEVPTFFESKKQDPGPGGRPENLIAVPDSLRWRRQNFFIKSPPIFYRRCFSYWERIFTE